MHPELAHPFGLTINSYGFMIMVGFLIATAVAVRRGKTIGIPADLIMDVGIYSMIMGIVGAKINHMLEYSSQYQGSFEHMADFSSGEIWLIGVIVGAIIPFIVVSYFQKKRQMAAGASTEQATRKFSPARLMGYVLVDIVCAFLGGCAANMLINHFSDIKSWTSGFVFYGGLITAVATGILVIRLRKQKVLPVADIAAPSIMLGLAFGRVGGFLYGCCYGKATDFVCAVTFPPKSAAYWDGDQQTFVTPYPVHPTQLYETIAGLVLFFILSRIWKSRKRDGEVLAWLGILYPVWRFSVEFLRGDNELFWFGALTFSQGVSILIFVASVLWLVSLKKRNPAQQITS